MGRVAGLAAGVYEYMPDKHALPAALPTGGNAGETGGGAAAASAHANAVQSTTPHAATVSYACQPWLHNSSALLLLAGNPGKTKAKGGLYSRFCEDLITLEAGMAAQVSLPREWGVAIAPTG